MRGGSSKICYGWHFSEFIIGNFLQMWPTNPLFLAKVIFIGDALLSVRCHRWTRRGVSLWIDISTVDYCRSSTCHDVTMLRLLYFLYLSILLYFFRCKSCIQCFCRFIQHLGLNTWSFFLPEILQVRFMFMFNFQSLFFFQAAVHLPQQIFQHHQLIHLLPSGKLT